MPKQNWFHMVQVSGKGVFPLDMLRYDDLLPMSLEDEKKCYTDWDALAKEGNTNKPQIVNLYRNCKTQHWTPTVDRWRSFMWNVVQHKVGPSLSTGVFEDIDGREMGFLP